MSNAAILFIVFVVCLLLTVPISYSLGIAAMVYMLYTGILPMSFLPQTFYNSMNSFTLLAVPFFILCGDIMLKGGISERLINMIKAFTGSKASTMGTVTVIACAIFAAISGSGPATVAAIGGIMIPAMVDENYDVSYACGLSAAAGALGPVIPPSLCLIMYGIIAQESITDLFTGGFLPGILMALMLIIYNIIVTKRQGFGSKEVVTYTKEEKIKAFKEGIWALLMPVIILGSIYSGICTPTEAAILACDYGLIVGFFIYRDLKIKDIFPLLKNTAKTVGMSMVLVCCATAFGRLLTMEQVPQMLAEFIFSITNNRIIILLIINIVLLVVGCFMETLAAIIILAPLLLEIVEPLGVSSLHFGIMMTVNLVIGMCTPPVGCNLFVASGIGNIPIEKTMRWLFPMILVMIGSLMIITYCPPIVEFLPSIL